MENKSKKVISIVLTMSLILVIIGVTYAAFIYSKEGTKENKVTTGKINFVYNETTNGIEISNALPMEDDEGKLIKETDENATRGYFDFNVEATLGGNTTIPYYVYAVDTTDAENKLDPKYVKMYLTDQSDTPYDNYKEVVPTFDDLEDIKREDEGKEVKGKLLYQDVANKTETKYFRLRMWVREDYDVTGEEKTFKLRVDVSTEGEIIPKDQKAPTCSIENVNKENPTRDEDITMNIKCTDESGVVKADAISKEDVYFTGGYCTSDSGVPFYDTISYQTSSINNGTRIKVTINPIVLGMDDEYYATSSWGYCLGNFYNLHLRSSAVTDISGNENAQLDYGFKSLITRDSSGYSCEHCTL